MDPTEAPSTPTSRDADPADSPPSSASALRHWPDEGERAAAAALVAEGLALIERGDGAGGAERLRAALRQDPRQAAAHLGLGRLCEAHGSRLAAILHYQAATALEPGNGLAFRRLGDSYMTLGKDRPALSAYARAVTLDPRDPVAHYHQALTFLAQGSFARGWRGFEWRWRVPGAPEREVLLPPWDGPAPAEATVLVIAEGRTVEDVMFCHCLGDLLAGGARVRFRGAAPLTALVCRSFPGVQPEASAPEGPAEAAAALAAPLGSLPMALRRHRADFARPPGYLAADGAASARWRARYRTLGPGPVIGLAWRGQASWPAEQAPDLPPPALAPLLAIAGTHAVSLEPAASGDDISSLAASGPEPFGHWPDRGSDLDDLAARIDATDLVVAPPGVTAALAGALGKPVWVLAPPVPGWPWGLRGRKLPWFPRMTMVRQRPGQDWARPVCALASALAALD